MSTLTPDQVFSMQMELTELRNKLSRYSKLGEGGVTQSKMEELIIVLGEKESEILKLSNENSYFNEKFASVQQLLGQVEEERASLVSTNESLEKKLKDSERYLLVRESEVSTLQARIQEAEVRRSSEIREIKTDNAAMIREIERLRETVSNFEARQVQFEVLKREKVESSVREREFQVSLEDAKRNYERTEESLNASLSYLKRVIKEHELTDLENHKKIKKCEKYRIEQTKKLNAEITRLNSERSRDKASFDKAMKEQQIEMAALVENLDEAVETKERELERAKNENQSIVDSITAELKTLRKNLQQKEESLKDKDSTVEKLRKRVGEFERQVDSLEQSAEDLNKDIANDRSHAEAKINQLEREKMKCHEKVVSLEDTNKELSALLDSTKKSNEQLTQAANTQIMEMSAEVDKSKIIVEKLKAENTKFNTNIEELNDSLKLSSSAKNATDRKNEKLKAELDLFMSAQSKEILEHKKICMKLKGDIKSLEEKLKQKEGVIHELSQVKESLDERKEILKNMITQNRQLSDDYAEARSLTSELKEEMEKYLREKDNAIRKTVLIEKTMSENEKRHQEQLDSERILRMETEAHLTKLEKQLAFRQKQDKMHSELEKENERLKDKIRRQEGFLKKKLDQDRALRQSSVNHNTTSKIPQRKVSDSYSLNGCYSKSFDEN